MVNDSPDLSCYTTSLIAKYASELAVREDVLLHGISEHRDILLNPMEWVGASIVTKMLDNFARASGGGMGAIEEMAKYITRNQIAHFQIMFLKIAPLSLINARITRLGETSISKTFRMYLERISRTTLEFKTVPNPPEKYSEHMCAYNKGCGIAALELKGFKNVRANELCCAGVSSVPACIVHFEWDSEPPVLQKAKAFFLFQFRSQRQIVSHIQTAHERLQSQYKETKSLQEFYTHIMRSMDEGIVWCGRDSGITFANDGFLRIAGLPEVNVIGKTFFEIAEGHRARLDVFDECLQHPGSAFNREVVFERGGEDLRIGAASFTWVESTERDPGFLVVVRDVTEARKMEKKLYLAEGRFRSLYQNSPALILGLDLKGKVIYANPSMVEESGYTENELKALTFKDLIAPDSPVNFEAVFSERLDSPSRLQEVHFKTKSGDWKAVAMTTYPLLDEDGNVAGLSGIGVDVSETKRLNEQVIKAQRMELLGQLAGGLAHDFNNIMTSVYGLSEQLSRKAPNDDVKRKADTISQGSVRAIELIKKLLSFSRGGETTKKVDCELISVIKEAESLIRGSASSSISVRFDLPLVEYHITADPGSIHQCIMNLFVNARDAIRETERQTGEIVVRIGDSPRDGQVRITVEDTGPGVPPHVIEKIFDPFFTTKKERGGTGLGLSMVYGIVKAQNGEINLESHPGEGSTFTIDLPLREAEEKKERVPGVIVVLDDDPMVQGLCSQVLKHYGYRWSSFGSMNDAVQWMKENPQKVWFPLSDIFMPDMVPDQFVTACQEVRKDMPIVWMSGNASGTPAGAGPNDRFLPKPFTPVSLLQAIRELPPGVGVGESSGEVVAS